MGLKFGFTLGKKAEPETAWIPPTSPPHVFPIERESKRARRRLRGRLKEERRNGKA